MKKTTFIILGLLLIFLNAALVFAQSYPEGFSEFVKLEDDFGEPLDYPIFDVMMVRQLSAPASYQIIDVDEPEDTYCKRFTAESMLVVKSAMTRSGIPLRFQVKLEGESVDYCNELVKKCETANDGSEICFNTTLPYSLEFLQVGSTTTVTGANNNLLTIIRKPLEKLMTEDGRSYSYTKVITKGLLNNETLPDGTVLHVYTTSWKPVFNDLRGIGFIKATKRIPASIIDNVKSSTVWEKFYESPPHNKQRSDENYNSIPYESCINDTAYDFCFKQKGNKLVMATKLEITNRITFWIDEHFRR